MCIGKPPLRVPDSIPGFSRMLLFRTSRPVASVVASGDYEIGFQQIR